jgi:hypothetical protein
LRRTAPFLAVLSLVLLAACASLPQSGPVRRGDPDVTEPGSIALLARLPNPGDDPEQIVDGFLRAAAAGLTDDFTIAREFLAEPARSTWNPLARVDVYARQPVLSSGEDDVVEAAASVTATLDGDGRFTEAEPNATARLAFGLVRDDRGRWRIRSLEDGLILSEPIFRSLFDQVALYFVTPRDDALVPETRWYPRRSAETAAVLGLLGGPSAWLENAAASRFPEGTRLVLDTVTVRAGAAQVDLSREALDASPHDRSLMLAQLTETLNGLPRVRSVSVTVAGAPLEPVEARRDLAVDPSVGATPVVLAGDTLRGVEGGELVPWLDVGPVTVPEPSHPAVPFGDGVPVVLSGGRALVTVPAEGDAPATLLSGAEPLTPPSFDRLGWVWTASSVTGNVLHAVRVDGTRVAVEAEWLTGRRVLALRISREGARALVLSVVGSSPRLEVAAVLRDPAGAPVGLGEPLRFGHRVTHATTAVWVDQQTGAVLGRVGEGTADTVVLTVVGGPSSALPGVDGAVGVAAGKGDRLLFVSTAAGELFARNGLGWALTAAGVRDPAFPG